MLVSVFKLLEEARPLCLSPEQATSTTPDLGGGGVLWTWNHQELLKGEEMHLRRNVPNKALQPPGHLPLSFSCPRPILPLHQKNVTKAGFCAWLVSGRTVDAMGKHQATPFLKRNARLCPHASEYESRETSELASSHVNICACSVRRWTSLHRPPPVMTGILAG
jgi:hypothetical protein